MRISRWAFLAAGLLLGAVFVAPDPARALELVDFDTAQTAPPGSGRVAAGIGGLFTQVRGGQYLTYLPFASLRLGILPWAEVGLQVVTVPPPYNTVGPALGGQLSLKLRLTPRKAPLDVAIVLEAANAAVEHQGQSSSAWSPGAALILTYHLAAALSASVSGHYAYVFLPATGDAFQAAGGSLGFAIDLSPSVSLRPAVGLTDLWGSLLGSPASGWGLSVGAVLSALFGPS